MTLPVLCIGAVLWDVIGRSGRPMRIGSDVPGEITRLPGGVAMNIAMTLARFGAWVELLSAVGQDAEGDELIAAAGAMGLGTSLIHRTKDTPTDRYMAIEAPSGLIAAIADAYSLEKAGEAILTPLTDGRLGSEDAPFEGIAALDGNLTETLLRTIAHSPLFARTDLRVAPASPGKAERLAAFIEAPGATLYVNLEEAGLLCDEEFGDARSAAEALIAMGVARTIVTDGPNGCADAGGGVLFEATPPQVRAKRVTGAGDTFMAAHITSEAAQVPREGALARAAQAAAEYVSGKDPT